MGLFSIKLPDVGEGIAEAELVEWNVAVGEVVREDDVLGAVMTDKATVEIPSAVTGTVVWLGAEIGDVISVGSELIRLEVDGEGNVGDEAADVKISASASEHQTMVEEAAPKTQISDAALAGKHVTENLNPTGFLRPEGEKPLASPSVRLRAREAGVDLRLVRGSGPALRITHDDLDKFFTHDSKSVSKSGNIADTSVTEIKIVGLRRKIAERMVLAKSRIPHITIVEEVDVTDLEELRVRLNNENSDAKSRLTVLPFLMRSMVKAVSEQPALNALYDDEAGILRQHGGVHIGFATQTPNGLVVPVVHHAEALNLWDLAADIARLAQAARDGTAKREELTRSTITISSLGALGALATTPIINHPEVAIVGVNRMSVRPVWSGTQFVPRKMMNLSCSFDHRVIDGWDAAVFVQRLKTLLESPAMIFLES